MLNCLGGRDFLFVKLGRGLNRWDFKRENRCLIVALVRALEKFDLGNVTVLGRAGRIFIFFRVC